MIARADIAHDYVAAGALHDRLNMFALVTEHVVLMKSGALGVLVQLRGHDYECMGHAERARVVHRFQQALRLLDEHTSVYQYLLKRKGARIPWPSCTNAVGQEATVLRRGYFEAKRDELHDVSLYVGFVLERRAARTGALARLLHLIQGERTTGSRVALTKQLTGELLRDASRLEEKVRAFIAQLGEDIGAHVLGQQEVFAFLRTLLNYDRERAEAGRLKYLTNLDYYASDSTLECHRDHLRLGDAYVKVLVLKEPPTRTFAHMLQELYELPGNVLLVSEWQRQPHDRMRRLLQAKRRHHHFGRTSLLAHLGTEPAQPGDFLINDSAVATVSDIGACVTEMEVNGEFIGTYSCTVVAYDDDLAAVERTVGSVIKVFARFDATLIEERFNSLNAWLATIFGNGVYNLRRLLLLSRNCADLSFLFSLDTGDATNQHLQREYAAVFETEHQTPYLYNLHVGDVPHSLLLGSTGSGKTFLSAFLLAHCQRYDPLTTVFTIGGGYRELAAWCDGGYVRIGLDQADATINPFELPPTPQNLHFLHALVRVLIQSQGQYAMTLRDDRDLHEQIQSLYVLDPEQRRLFTLSNILPRHLSQALRRWVQGGAYGALFDNPQDSLTFRRFQVYNFQGLDQYPMLLEPLFFYVLHRARTLIYGNPWASDSAGTLKLFLCDEAWWSLKEPVIRAYIAEFLKTGRDLDTAVILATQSSEDLASAAMLPIVLESCPTKLFLANPGMHAPTYQALFGLNDAEMALLAALRPRQQFLLKRPGLAKLLNLSVDADTLARLGGGPRVGPSSRQAASCERIA
jgi:type IV secretion/conjugal transfer VirB4 family ATPase